MISYIQNSILRRDKDEEYIDRTEIYERNSISRKYKCNIDDELNSFRFEDEDKFSESKNEFDIEIDAMYADEEYFANKESIIELIKKLTA